MPEFGDTVHRRGKGYTFAGAVDANGEQRWLLSAIVGTDVLMATGLLFERSAEDDVAAVWTDGSPLTPEEAERVLVARQDNGSMVEMTACPRCGEEMAVAVEKAVVVDAEPRCSCYDWFSDDSWCELIVDALIERWERQEEEALDRETDMIIHERIEEGAWI